VETGHQIIEINAAQVEQFAGNMLALINIKGERLQVMSDRAYQALDETQVSAIRSHAQILTLTIPTIEEIGGGSVRCMIAEIFCPKL
ncbi:MAG: amidinotransferase, partial [Bacteroidetes bacterium]|nr:amidinotransferase [Bacteroidota bacterium]